MTVLPKPINRGKREAPIMKPYLKRSLMLVPMLAPVLLSACVVWQSDYDKLNDKYHAAQQQIAADQQTIAANKQEIANNKVQISRLQGAIKYTINSDLLFASGSWEMAPAGQAIIAKMASQLAPMQQSKVVVTGYTDNAPVGAALAKQGVTSNQILSQKRAETVMQFMVSHGVKPDMASARGMGEQDPVAPNDTPAGRSQNRRVEISLAPPGA
jgi:chemotaxis protein MotB